MLNEVCQNHDECHQPGQDSSRLMCIEGQCKCKVGFTEEGDYCRGNKFFKLSETIIPFH